MSIEENVQAIVGIFPKDLAPTEKAKQNLRQFLDEQDPRRIKKMRRKLEEFLAINHQQAAE